MSETELGKSLAEFTNAVINTREYMNRYEALNAQHLALCEILKPFWDKKLGEVTPADISRELAKGKA